MILMNDFKAEPEELLTAQLKATERVLRSGWYILGQEVKAFESAWAKRCNTKESVAVANGMDAIEIALRALRIGEGDEVITTSMTAFASVLAIVRAGATPVLADIDPSTAIMSMDSVARCLSAKTKAVLLVHLYGQVPNMDLWKNFCKEKKIYLIEDCAQSHLAEWNGKVAGSFGEAGAYSFYPTKNLGAIGDAGALVTNSEKIAEMSRTLRNYGQSERYHHPELGLNSRMDELHAAILSERLKWLDSFTEQRRVVAETYFSKISNSKIRLLTKPIERSNHVYHLFVLLSDQREQLVAHLNKRGVSSLSHYPVPIHKQKPCLDYKKDPAGLSLVEKHAKECLSIPCHPQMTKQQIEQVIEALNAF